MKARTGPQSQVTYTYGAVGDPTVAPPALLFFSHVACTHGTAGTSPTSPAVAKSWKGFRVERGAQLRAGAVEDPPAPPHRPFSTLAKQRHR